MRTLLKGGTVVSARGTRRADVLLENGRVKQVGRLILGKADRVEDVEGCLLFPGFIWTSAAPLRRMILLSAAVRRCGAAPPPSLTLPVPIRVKAFSTDWSSGTVRPMAGRTATMAST